MISDSISMAGTGASMSDNSSGQADDRLRFEPYEFVSRQPAFAVLLLVVVGVAGVVGTLGNFLILISVATRKELRNVQSVFIVNLACSDLYVTMLADPLSIVGTCSSYKPEVIVVRATGTGLRASLGAGWRTQST